MIFIQLKMANSHAVQRLERNSRQIILNSFSSMDVLINIRGMTFYKHNLGLTIKFQPLKKQDLVFY